MAEKALIQSIQSLQTNRAGDYEIVVVASVSRGVGSCVPVYGYAMAPNFIALLPPWRERIRDAIVAAALAEYGIVVDGVMFPDFTSLDI